MNNLYQLHSKMFRRMSAEEVMVDRENEFNHLISKYELDCRDVAKYLLLVRETREERVDLIHKLLPEKWEYAESIIHLSDCYGKPKD